jgi:hypothetical protein
VILFPGGTAVKINLKNFVLVLVLFFSPILWGEDEGAKEKKELGAAQKHAQEELFKLKAAKVNIENELRTLKQAYESGKTHIKADIDNALARLKIIESGIIGWEKLLRDGNEYESYILERENKVSREKEFEEACAFDKLDAGTITAADVEISLRNFIKKYPRDQYSLTAYAELVRMYTQDATVKRDAVKALQIIKEAYAWLHKLVKDRPEFLVPNDLTIYDEVRFPPVDVFFGRARLLVSSFGTTQLSRSAREEVNGRLLDVFARLTDADYLRMVKAANYLGWESVDATNPILLNEAVLSLKKKLLKQGNFVVVYGFSPSLNALGREQFALAENGGLNAVTTGCVNRMRNLVRLAVSSLIVRIKLHRVGNQPDSKLLLYVKKLIEVGDTSAYADVIQCLEKKEQLETALDCVQEMAKYVVLDDNKKRVRFLPFLTKLQQDPELSAEVKEKVKACIEYITPYEQ